MAIFGALAISIFGRGAAYCFETTADLTQEESRPADFAELL